MIKRDDYNAYIQRQVDRQILYDFFFIKQNIKNNINPFKAKGKRKQTHIYYYCYYYDIKGKANNEIRTTTKK